MKYLEIINGISYLVIKGNIEQDFVGKIRIDSRKVKQGDIFVAMSGSKVDGNDFINTAIMAGAKCIITENDISVADDIIVIKVLSTRDCLLELARVIRKHYINIPLIAVTGSVGKSTTKEIIYYLLSNKYHVLKSEGNHNNMIGAPITLFELDDSYDVCVLELGMNHLGEIRALTGICLPTDAIITNIGTSHIGMLGSQKNIFKAKMEIVESLNNGTLLVNGDDKYLKNVKSDTYRVIKCGKEKNNDIRAFDILSTDKQLYFKVKTLDTYYKILFPIPNESLVNDILLAIYIAIKYNVDSNYIAETLSNYQSLQNRNQIFKLNHNMVLVDDSYNSSLESLQAGLKMIDNFKHDKILVIGEILELGEHTENIYKKINKLMDKYEKIILVGKKLRLLMGSNLVYCDNYSDAIKYLDTMSLDNKLIYIKGSHKLELNYVSEYIKKRG